MAAPGTPPILGAKPGVLGTVSQEDIDLIRQAHGAGRAPRLVPPQPQAQPAISSPPEPDVEQDGLPQGTPKEQYAYAFGLLRQTRFDEAEDALRAFLERHPDDALAPNARYWLGETHYVRGDFASAAQVFVDGFQKAPQGPKAADTMLKLGMSLGNMGKKADACVTYEELLSRFPNASRTIKSRIEADRRKLGCQ